VLRLAVLDDAVLHQGGRGAVLHAGPAGHALGIHERLALARRYLRIEATARDGQREGALHSSQARTQREQTMHLAGSKLK
jgi:hypothetical protein